MDINEIKTHALNQRRNVVKMVYNAQSGHPGGSLSATDILAVLYFGVMNINEDNVDSVDRDRFVLSKGHASPALYAVLAEKGFVDEKELVTTFRQVNSKFQGHPNMNYVRGVDMSTGSLGQGLSTAVGMALANKLDQKEHRVYCLLGDGECEEGMVYEAMMAASHYELDNLCVLVDYNHLQIDGNVDDVIGVSPIDKKFEAFNFNVLSVDGHDHEALLEAFNKAKTLKGKPTCIICNTTKGKGVSFMEDQASWHGKAPNDEEFVTVMKELEVQNG